MKFFQAAFFLSLFLFAVAEKPVLRGADGYVSLSNHPLVILFL
jgi:hypothetical protein